MDKSVKTAVKLREFTSLLASILKRLRMVILNDQSSDLHKFVETILTGQLFSIDTEVFKSFLSSC